MRFRQLRPKKVIVWFLICVALWKLSTWLLRTRYEGSDAASSVPAERKQVRVAARSDHAAIFVRINDDLIVESLGPQVDRGIHVVVLNQVTGAKMAHQVFDTYLAEEDGRMVDFLDGLRPDRLLVFVIKDEGTYRLGSAIRSLLQDYGSQHSGELAWRDTWIMVTFKNGPLVHERYRKNTEGFNAWSGPAEVDIVIDLKERESGCVWPPSSKDDRDEQRRQVFCSKYEGYGPLCSCFDSEPLLPAASDDDRGAYKNFLSAPIASVPVAVIAANRPSYLLRGLRSLLSARGASRKMITVFVDGRYEEPTELAKLFGLRVIQHSPRGTKNARISQHYKASLTATFNLYGAAKYAIVIEEDMDVSPDFFSYFNQTMYLFHEDPSIYCISAWNDQGYEHSSHDERLLYRIESMPGLGWMLPRQLYKEELEPQWPGPDKQWDWDMWMRNDAIRKDRECIIPDVSRSFHFGLMGVNMNPYFHSEYFQGRSINKRPHVVLKDVGRMVKHDYEFMINEILSEAEVLDHTKNPCAKNFVPDTQNRTYALFIRMAHAKDFETFKMLARKECFHIWDLDIRGFHKSMWRMFLKVNHIIIVGYPASPYSSYKPENVQPVYIPAPPPTVGH